MTWAGPVSQEEAKQKAVSFLSSKTFSGKKRAAMRQPGWESKVQLAKNMQDRLYLFTVQDDGGYVVVSGDDRTPAILGYADEGRLDIENMPENMKAWLQSYVDQMKQTDAGQAPATIVSGEAVGPLLTTMWDQGYPYYLLCPVMPETNKHPYTGCVATAMAQVMNYLDYDRSVHAVSRTSYKAAEWNQLIYDELAAGRPLLYNGQSIGGGHSFVIDGYDKDNYFHVKWGWSGNANGYFLLSALDPSNNSGSGASSTTDGYNFWQGAVIGIQPQKGTPPAPIVMTTKLAYAAVENGQATRGSIDENFQCLPFFSDNYYDDDSQTFDFTWGLFTEDGEFITPCFFGQYSDEESSWEESSWYSYWTSGGRYVCLGMYSTSPARLSCRAKPSSTSPRRCALP